MANLDFYNKEIANIQEQLLDKLDNLVAGLGQVTDTELMQIAKQIDFFAEMETLGFTKLMNRVGKTFDDEIARVFGELSKRELGKVSVASIETLRELKNFEMTYLTNGVRQYSDQLKTAMLRGIITGETNAQIMAGLQTGFGVGTFISSSETSFLINDAFATFSSATRAKAFEEFPDITFQYIGARKDEKTRDSCKWILNNNKPRTQKEIKELKVPPRKDGSKHISFNRRGGYNCRHRWVRV